MPDTLTQTPSVSTAYLTELRNQERRQIVSALVELSCGPSNVLDVIADFVIEQKASAFDAGVKHGWENCEAHSANTRTQRAAAIREMESRQTARIIGAGP
jgi:hypothetical protein